MFQLKQIVKYFTLINAVELFFSETAEAPIGKYTVDEVCKLMAVKPDWCEGLPLSAAGYLAPAYYFKD